MPANLISDTVIAGLTARAAGLDQPGGDPRLKAVMHRLLADLFRAIDDLDISMDEFWAAIAYLTRAGTANELGLVVPGLAIEHFLDLRLDEAERRAGLAGGTVRTIEGPLYVPGAPLAKGEARLDDGSDAGEVLFMEGVVRDRDGRPVPGAIVDVWHANSFGFYSFFGPEQTPFNLRRRIETDGQGRYRFRSIMPSGYGCPPGSETAALLARLGRHGQRPAHIHFFVSAPGFRHLTTQINIDGDQYLHDDFAFGTRDELIPPVERVETPDAIAAAGLERSFARIRFDFTILPDIAQAPPTLVRREHARAA